MYLSNTNQPTANSELKKLTGSQKLQIAYGNDKLKTILSQVNASQNSRQTIGNNHNGFQPLVSIKAESFDNTLKVQFKYYSEKRVKKRVKKRQHKIKQTNYWPVFKETIKVEDKQKRYSRVETLH